MPKTLLHRMLESAERRALFWWQPRNGEVNVGAHLSKVIVSSMLALRGKELINKRDPTRRLLATGSILHFARQGDTIWGSSGDSRVVSEIDGITYLDVRAVLGPRTRELLLECGIRAPEVYGDPGLLMPRFFPADALGPRQRRPYVVVPHFNEPPAKYKAYAEHLVFPNVKTITFVRKLLGAELVISSSLHGLVLAEAYGIPAVYLDWGNGDDRLKYDDYYLGTGRPQWHLGRSVEECLALGGNASFDLAAAQERLLDSFPYDLW